MPPKRAIKRIIQHSLKTLLAALQPGPSREVRVLEYHYVDRTGSSLSVTPEQFFLEHLRCMRRAGYRALSADEYLDRIDSGKSGTREVFITFDDGFDNFAFHAAPLLADMQMPATVFVVVGLAGQPPQWLIRDRPTIESMMAQFHLPAEEKANYDRAMEFFVQSRLMTWDEIARLRQLGIDVHSHTMTHPFLANVSPEQLREELEQSQKVLAEKTGVTSQLICFPYGSCNDAVADAARSAGYRVGFLSGRLGIEGDPMRTGRVPVGGSMSVGEFGFRLRRAYDTYRRLTQKPVER